MKYCKPDLDIDNYRQMLRSAGNFNVPKPCNTFFTKTYSFVAPRLFNKIPVKLGQLRTSISFTKKFRFWLFNQNDLEGLLAVIACYDICLWKF